MLAEPSKEETARDGPHGPEGVSGNPDGGLTMPSG